MSRYRIALGKKPKEIKLEKLIKKDIPLGFTQAHFTNVKVMTDYMLEIGGKWIPESNLYFKEVPLIGYKSTMVDEIALIRAVDYHQTKKSLTKSGQSAIDKEKVLDF